MLYIFFTRHFVYYIIIIILFVLGLKILLLF